MRVSAAGWTRLLLLPTRLLPNLRTDGSCQGRLRVYMNHASWPGAVALRSQTVLTGSGYPRYAYGGLGEATHVSTRIPAAGSRISRSRTASLGIGQIMAVCAADQVPRTAKRSRLERGQGRSPEVGSLEPGSKGGALPSLSRDLHMSTTRSSDEFGCLQARPPGRSTQRSHR